MDHYLDIKLLPDPEFPPTELMNALFAKFHRALVELKSTGIGVSFPGIGKDPKCRSLGDCLRLHGTLVDLHRLMESSWLTGMRDHTTLNGPTKIPANASHWRIRRVQTDSNPERLRRRLMKRKGLGEEEARQTIPKDSGKRLDLPYVTLKSKSTGQVFRLFIDQQASAKQKVEGLFNYYGLSRTATVPWF